MEVEVKRDQGTITDICNTSDVEVELVSLIEEQIPRYKLRADTLTQFGENEVATKWKGLRDRYLKLRREYLQKQSSGAGSDDVSMPKWKLYTILDGFLGATVEPRRTSSNIMIKQVCNRSVAHPLQVNQNNDSDISAELSQRDDNEARVIFNHMANGETVEDLDLTLTEHDNEVSNNLGYENEDWYIHTPVISPDTEVDLSPELIEETLKYFILCGDRLSQMTKTYNDIDAVSRLLEEKERDLELAARIGQSLLEQNKDLRQRNETLEQEFTIANDTVEHLTFEVLAATERVTQLRHELSLKTGLLQIYSQDLDTDSEAGTPVKEKSFIANWETLQKKIQNLECENVELRTEASHRMDDIEEVEKKELQLISDCVRELADTNSQLNHFKEELAKKNEDSVRQQEEITQLLSQVVDLQRKNRALVAENSDLQNKLLIVRECQNELSQELIEIKEKYGELLAAFQELQDETRKSARRNTLPRNSGMWPYGTSSPYMNPDSLASEMESSMGRESDGYGSDERTSQSKRIFETVKCANGSRFVRQKRSQGAGGSSSAVSPTYTSCFNPGTSSKFSSFGQLSSISSHLASDTESAYADSYHTDDESLYSSFGSASVQPPPPASNLAQELEAALKDTSSGLGTPSRRALFSGRCGSPDSSISGRSSSLGGPLTFYAQQGARNFHLPEKLQIVKPLEGSQTLHHWQRLATPHLGALFEVRQGVQVKGGDKPEKVPEPESYSLSDYEEEDDEEYSHPGKSFMDTGSIYTFTNSTITHPSDHTLVTPSYPVLQLSTRIVSEPPSNLNSPQSTMSRLKDRATSTFSTTQGLAKLLNERGIHGMIPTVINNKAEKTISPPPTPAPSPENSPPPSPPPYSPVRVPDLLAGGDEGLACASHIAKGAHLLRTKSQRRKKKANYANGDENVSRESKSQQTILSINLLEKLSRIGLENIMATSAPAVYHRSTALGRSSRTKLNLNTIDDDAPLTMNNNNASVLETGTSVTRGSSDRPLPAVLPLFPSESEQVIRKPDSLSDSGISEESSKNDGGINPLSNQQWGYVPNVMKSPASLGLTPGVPPPLSYMPNPMLQLNCLRPSGRSQDVGTVGTLRILRKGGYS